MNTAAIKKLRAKLAAGRPALGLWITLEAPSLAEIAVELGLDWIVIDAEHGHLDWKEIVEHLRAVSRSDVVAMVRIAELNAGLIKRVLDIGADGVVVPWIETAEQLRQAVAYAKYPLEGVRGIGAERATAWGTKLVEHTAEANDHVLVVPIIETVRAAANVAEMCQVDGVELFFFGPADFSSTAGYRGQWEGPGVTEKILAIKDTLRTAGKHCGVVTTNHDNLRQRIAQGFGMLGLGLDTGLVIRALREALDVAGDASISAKKESTAAINPNRSPQAGATKGGENARMPALTSKTPQPKSPASIRPDRPEVITSAGDGKFTEITDGVKFECLVGSHNQAHKLTTGIVTFAKAASLPYHTHTFTESITLLRGELTVEVEGRAYALRKFDNLVIPPGVAHHVVNTSPRASAMIHIAMATDAPSRTLVDDTFAKRAMPVTAAGEPGAERITRFQKAERYSAGPNTEFIDCFNESLLPGIEMSGGYALFHPGGRLPAHLHDFDESISIISGQATCVVEGRRYAMSNLDTALEPRGRVHYFINESQGPMEMLWVYAGPRPERIEVDEGLAEGKGTSMAIDGKFHVALTGDFIGADGQPRYRDVGLDVLAADSQVSVSSFSEHKGELQPEQIGGAHGLVVLTPRVTAQSLADSRDLLAIGRFGVGYDSVDVPACTAADVLLFIAAGAVDRPVAEATVGWMLALTHHIRVKDLLMREGRWDERSRFMGCELRDRTLGVVGFGGIGRTVVKLLAGFGMNQPLVFDPYLDDKAAAELGVRKVSLDELMAQADFVSVHCPLTAETRNLITARELALMKPQAYLLNTARGGIVDEDALYAALSENRIAGAAIDCFVGEPITVPHRFAQLDNVLLAPHAIAWTDELFRDIGRTVCQGMLDLAHGRRPRGIVNPEVLDRPGFQQKWNRLRVS